MEDRLTDVEIKLAFLEKLTQDLDEVIRDLHDRVDRLEGEVAALRERVVAGDDGPSATGVEKPPHY